MRAPKSFDCPRNPRPLAGGEDVKPKQATAQTYALLHAFNLRDWLVIVCPNAALALLNGGDALGRNGEPLQGLTEESPSACGRGGCQETPGRPKYPRGISGEAKGAFKRLVKLLVSVDALGYMESLNDCGQCVSLAKASNAG